MTIQIAGVIEAAAPGDLLQSQGGKTQQLFGLGQPPGDHILIQSRAIIQVKFPGQVVFTEKEPLRELVQGKLFRIMFIQIFFYLGHLQTAGVFFFPGFRNVLQ